MTRSPSRNLADLLVTSATIPGSAFGSTSIDSFSDVDLTVQPEVLEIQLDAPAAGHGSAWLWTWITSSLPYARINITNASQLSVPLYKQGTYQINNFANELHGDMTQTHQFKLKWIEGAGDENNISDWVTYSTATHSHPDINAGTDTTVQRLAINVPSTIVLPTLVAPNVSYDVATTTGAYVFSGTNMGNNLQLGPFYRGGTYTFNLTATGHPFYLTTDNSTGFVTETYVGEYTSGVTGSRNETGTLTFVVPVDAPDTLYYQCGIHSVMRGAIVVKDLAVETNENGNYIIYGQHSQEDHAQSIEIRPIPTLTSQMCIVYDAVNQKFVPQDLATYVENTPAFKNKIKQVAGTATLVAPDGTSLVASVQIYTEESYLPQVSNISGDIAFTQDTSKIYIWNGTAWIEATASVDLSGYVTTGDLPVVPSTIVDLGIVDGEAGQALVTDGAGGFTFADIVSGGGGSGVTVVASNAFFPEAATVGAFAYTQDTNKMYVYNGATWILVFTATTPNNAPNFVTGPEATYLLATNGAATTIEMVAQDPEGVPVTWSYTITEGSITNGGGPTATITQVDNILTITPTTNTARGGQFTLTIVISDGVNFANRSTRIRLSFNVQNYSYGATWVEDILYNQADHGTTTDPYWGTQVAAHGGQLAISGRNNGSVTTDYGISIFDTIATPATVTGYFDGTPYSNLALYGLEMHGDVIMASSDAGIRIISKVDGVWALRNTLATSTFGYTPYNGTMSFKFSSDGLIFVVANPYPQTGVWQAANEGKAFVFRRSDSSSIDFTLVQTIDFAAIAKPFTPDYFPRNVRISGTGKHITFASGGDGVDVAGDGIIVVTNEDTINSDVWAVTHAGTGNGGTRTSISGGMDVAFATSEDNFYLYNSFALNTAGNGTEACLFQYKYSDAANSWNRYEYAPYIGLRLKHSRQVGSATANLAWAKNIFLAQENGTGTGEITFMFGITGKSKIHATLDRHTYLLTARAVKKDLEGQTGNNLGFSVVSVTNNPPLGGSNYNRINHSLTYHPVTIAQSTTSNDGNPSLHLVLDNITGAIFVANHGWEPTVAGVYEGIVKRYKSARTTSDTTSMGPFRVFGYGKQYTTNISSDFGTNITRTASTSYAAQWIVPEGSYEFTGILVGPGGSIHGAKTATTYSTSGAPGGGMVWFNNYPVVPGDIITTFIGAPHIGTATQMYTSVYVNNVEIAYATSGSTNAAVSGVLSGAAGTGVMSVIPAGWVNGVDYRCDSGGLGGNGSTATAASYAGGGGGSGGYAGSGGKGGVASSAGGALGLVSASGGSGGATGYNGGGLYLFGLQAVANSGTTGNGYNNGEPYAVVGGYADSIHSTYGYFGWGSKGLNRITTRSNTSATYFGGRGGLHLEIGMGARVGPAWSTTNLQFKQIASLESE